MADQMEACHVERTEEISISEANQALNDSQELNNIVIASLKSMLEEISGHKETLKSITKLINESAPCFTPEDVHKCIQVAFPDVHIIDDGRAWEVVYEGLKIANNTDIENNLIEWVKHRFKEDKFGQLSYQTMKEIALSEIGFVKQHSIGSYVRKAFPNVYTRRSDRLRWFCGIALPEREITEEERKRNEWMENACNWIRSNICEDTTKKVKCTTLYSALTQYVGKTSMDNHLAAVKMVFPSVIRKTIDKFAHYIGICLDNDSTLENIKEKQYRKQGVSIKEYVVNDEELELVTWIRTVFIRNDNKKNKLIDVVNLLQKKLGEPIREKSCLKYIRKAFPHIVYRKRNGIAHISGIQLHEKYKPVDLWQRKSIQWLQQILEVRQKDYWERFSPLLDIMKRNLKCLNYQKLCQIVRVAFPNANIVKTIDGTLLYGCRLKHDHDSYIPPVFDDSDYIGDYSLVDVDEVVTLNTTTDITHQRNTPIGNNHSTALVRNPVRIPQNSCTTQSSPSFTDRSDCCDFKHNTTNSSDQNIIEKLEGKVDNLTSTITEMNNDIKCLRDELATSCRQKDTLIVQLQQTIMLLTQQQFQRIVRSNDSSVNSQANPPDITQNSTFISLPTIDLHTSVKSFQNGDT